MYGFKLNLALFIHDFTKFAYTRRFALQGQGLNSLLNLLQFFLLELFNFFYYYVCNVNI